MEAPPKVLAARIREMAAAAPPSEPAEVPAPPPPPETAQAAPRQPGPFPERQDLQAQKQETSQPVPEQAPAQPVAAAAPAAEPLEQPRPAEPAAGISPEISAAETVLEPGKPEEGQAVDLASISVDSSGAIVPLSQGAPGSLPVLEAIQAFLEEERAIMRRRFRALVLSSVAMIVAVISAGVWIGWMLIGSVRSDVEAVRGEVDTARERALYMQQQATSTLYSVSAAAQTLRKDMMNEKQALSTFRSGVDSRLDSYAGELGELRELLKMLRMESTSLKEELASVRTAATDRAAAETPLQPPPEFIEARIASRAGGAPATWRLPLPE